MIKFTSQIKCLCSKCRLLSIYSRTAAARGVCGNKFKKKKNRSSFAHFPIVYIIIIYYILRAEELLPVYAVFLDVLEEQIMEISPRAAGSVMYKRSTFKSELFRPRFLPFQNKQYTRQYNILYIFFHR